MLKVKKLLERVIWLNEVKPKFKENQIVKVTDCSRRIYGNNVVDFIAKVKKVQFNSVERFVLYEVEIICDVDGKELTYTCHAKECNIKHCRAKNVVNKLNKKDKYADCISL